MISLARFSLSFSPDSKFHSLLFSSLSFPSLPAEARLHFDIYDFTGEGKVDYFLLGDVLRSLDLRPTQTIVEKNGGQKKKGRKKIQSVRILCFCSKLLLSHLTGQKSMTFEEFLPIYSQVKKDKDVGAFEDLVEGLKVYDKAENGTMMEAELAHVMLSLGEKLTDGEAEEILKLCAGGADDEGFIKYESKCLNCSFAGKIKF